MHKIRFAHYSPNPWHRLFTEYLDDFEPVFDNCDKACQFIWCGSASCLNRAFPASLHYGKPIVAWVWDIPNIFPQHAGRVHTYINALRHCNGVIAASKFTQGVLKKYGIQARQMYFYADTRDLGSDEKRNQIIQVSRFTPHKKFENAIIAVKDLDTELINVGRPNDREYLQQLRSRSSENVFFKPDLSRPDMLAELRASKILVSSSIFEGWGLSPIEALFCGVPVVVSDLPVFREQYGGNVLYHDPEDPKSLRAQLERLLSDSALQAEIVQKGQECVKDFTPEKFVIRWRKQVENVI